MLELAQQLRRDGIAAELDQFHENEPLHWPRWCEEGMREDKADFVLCVATAEYKRRAEGRVPADVGRGVFWKGMFLYDEIYRNKGNRRCLPVLLEVSGESNIPRVLEGLYLVPSERPGFGRCRVRLVGHEYMPNLSRLGVRLE